MYIFKSSLYLNRMGQGYLRENGERALARELAFRENWSHGHRDSSFPSFRDVEANAERGGVAESRAREKIIDRDTRVER